MAVELEKLSRTLGDHERVRLCDALQTRREVRRIADYGLLLRCPFSDQVADHHQTRGDPDATWSFAPDRVLTRPTAATMSARTAHSGSSS